MAKVNAALMSFNASGQIGKSIVFGKWKGQRYARSYVIPGNPKTTAQTTQRDLFSFVHDLYKYATTDIQAPWIAYTKGKPLTGPNVWSSKNITALKGAANNNNMIFAPSVLGGPPGPTPTYTAGATQITIASADPSIPAGWTVTEFVACVCQQYTTFVETEPAFLFSGTDNTSPYSVVITGLTTAQIYVCGAFFKYLRADGTAAYGPCPNGTATPT